MNINKFTIKAQEAIQEAVNLAQSLQHQAIEPAHIMEGTFKSNEQIVSFLLQKAGANVNHGGKIGNDGVFLKDFLQMTILFF